MTRKVRAILGLIVVSATMYLAGCGHYICGATFGSSSCASSGGGLSQSGGGNATAAFLFAVDTTAGTVDGYTLNTSANTLALTSGSTAPAIAGDSGAGMVVAQGKYLYAAFRSTNQIFAWSISSAGILTTVTGSPFSATFLTDINAGAVGQQNMITDPAGSLLFLSDPVLDEIFVYQIGSGGTLTAVSGSPFAVPFGPLNLGTDGLGKYLYATDGFFGTHTATQVAAFSIGGTGSLTPVPGSPFNFPMWQVQGEPSGQFLIGTSGNSLTTSLQDDDHLYVFSINQSTGAITPVTGSPFPTKFSPFTIAVQPNKTGNLVYSFGVTDSGAGFNPVEGFQITATSGVLTEVTGSPFSSVATGFWGQFDQSGAFVFDYNAMVTNSGIVASVAALNVGSGGALSQPVSPVTLATQGYWAVTDAP